MIYVNVSLCSAIYGKLAFIFVLFLCGVIASSCVCFLFYFCGMDCADKNNSTIIPSAFRGLRVLLFDNNTETLLNTALILEGYSYKVTTTELVPVALSILQESKDRFDLIMADFDIPEMDGFKFIESVQLIKDFPMLCKM